MRTEHIYIPSWERFAGKPYVKPGKNTGLRTRKTGVIAGSAKPSFAIGETVKDAQELLAKRPYIEIYRFIRDSSLTWPHITIREHGLKNDVVVSKPAGPPQSLGELCIELEVEAMCAVANEYTLYPGFFAGTIKNIQNLRTLMYYKRKNHYIRDGFYDNTEYFQDQIDSGDPTRRATPRERLYKLIEMIRNT